MVDTMRTLLRLLSVWHRGGWSLWKRLHAARQEPRWQKDGPWEQWPRSNRPFSVSGARFDPPLPEQPKLPPFLWGAVALVGVLVLWLLPRTGRSLLWGLPLFGMAIKTLLGTGASVGDPTGEALRDGGLRLNNLNSQTYVCSSSQFGGTTAIQIIQNTINQANTDGVGRVFVPYQDNSLSPAVVLLPYAAGSVTFNPGVRMIAEGDTPNNNVWTMRAYGAHADNATDDDPSFTAINAAITAAGSGIISFMRGTTLLSGAYTMTVPTSMIGVPGGSYVTSTHTGTYNFLTFNYPQTGHFRASIDGLEFFGQGPALNGTAFFLGGTSGCSHFTMRNFRISNFGLALTWGNNAAFHLYEEGMILNNGQCLLFPVATSAGEQIRFLGVSFNNAPTSAQFPAQLQVNETNGGELYFLGCSFDDVGFQQAAGSVVFDTCHFELLGNVRKDVAMFIQTGGFAMFKNLKFFADPVSGITATEMFDCRAGGVTFSGIDAFSNSTISRLIKLSVSVNATILGNTQLGGITSLFNSQSITTGSVAALSPNVGQVQIFRSTGAYTITQNDNTIFASASGGGVTVQLPGVTTPGQVFTVKKVDSTKNAVTVWSGGAPLIDLDATTKLLSYQGSSITVISDGTNWQTIGRVENLVSPNVQTPTEAVLVSGVDVSTGSIIIPAALTAARVVGAPLNPTFGQRIVYTLTQDGTGGRAVTWNVIFKGLTWSDTGNALNTRSSIAFIFDGTNWNQDGAQAPYHL
jgi:hypothetical protein